MRQSVFANGHDRQESCAVHVRSLQERVHLLSLSGLGFLRSQRLQRPRPTPASPPEVSTCKNGSVRRLRNCGRHFRKDQPRMCSRLRRIRHAVFRGCRTCRDSGASTPGTPLLVLRSHVGSGTAELQPVTHSPATRTRAAPGSYDQRPDRPPVSHSRVHNPKTALRA